MIQHYQQYWSIFHPCRSQGNTKATFLLWSDESFNDSTVCWSFTPVNWNDTIKQCLMRWIPEKQSLAERKVGCVKISYVAVIQFHQRREIIPYSFITGGICEYLWTISSELWISIQVMVSRVLVNNYVTLSHVWSWLQAARPFLSQTG